MIRRLTASEYAYLSGLNQAQGATVSATEFTLVLKLAREDFCEMFTVPLGMGATGQPSMVVWAAKLSKKGRLALEESAGKTLVD